MLHIVYKPEASVSEPGGPLRTRAREGCARLRDSPFPKQALDSQNGTRSKRAFCGWRAFTATEPMLSLDFDRRAPARASSRVDCPCARSGAGQDRSRDIRKAVESAYVAAWH